MGLLCHLDGDALGIVRPAFENLVESPAVFIPLSEAQLTEIKDMMEAR